MQEKYKAIVYSKANPCLSADELWKYAHHQVSSAKRFEIEKHLLHCAFCAEAVEGFAHVDAHWEQHLQTLNAKIRQKSQPKTISLFSSKPLRIAAAVGVLGVVSAWVYWQIDTLHSSEKQTAMEMPSSTQQEPSDMKVSSDAAPLVSDAQSMPPSSPHKADTHSYTKQKDHTLKNQTFDVAPTQIADAEIQEEIPVIANTLQKVEEKNAASILSEKEEKEKVSIAESYTSRSFSTVADDIPTEQYEENNSTENLAISSKVSEIQMEKKKEKKADSSLSLESLTQQKQYAAILLGIEKNTIHIVAPTDEYYVGKAYFEKKKYTQALSHFDKAEKITNQVLLQEVHWHKAQCYLRLNDKEKAKVIFTQLAQSNGKYQSQAIEILKKWH